MSTYSKKNSGIVMSNVIIGAGPAGLYAAIQLHKGGLRNIVIYDPRAGVYTRPGWVTDQAYDWALPKKDTTEGLRGRSLDLESLLSKKRYHIKDLERALFAEVKKLGIRVEAKPFLRLYQDETAPGVVVFDHAIGAEEMVPADYVFDCSGAKRTVVLSVNDSVPTSPFKLNEMVDLPVKDHFIAYVKIDKAAWDRFNEASAMPDTSDSTAFAESILKLRALGWMELKFPRCYGTSFGKDKVCLYMHAPKHLEEKDYERWTQTVLECYSTPFHYQHVKPSRKYASKPRFMAFSINAEVLQPVSYAGDQLPVVVALGDAQIDFDYSLAHGILDGLKRIDSLLESIAILNGKIAYFDESEYLSAINEQVGGHKNAVIKAATDLKQSFSRAIEQAQLKLRLAMTSTPHQDKKQQLKTILQELDARQCYAKALQKMSDLRLGNSPIISDTLLILHHDLFKALELPLCFQKEIHVTEDLLKQLAAHWKDVGTAHFKKKQFTDAIEAYKKALEIYQLPVFQDKLCLKMTQLYSNLAIAYNMNNCFAEAMAAANTALDLNSQSQEHVISALQAKIVFN